ncbi:CBS domain-containing protein [Streptomyces sp. Wb2n-11]|uniref:CBS domain-containing protein n=1 Tax=Streptomyces sp. Wb2n-11 TaxID=1030533 RepID=UPI000A8E6EE6
MPGTAESGTPRTRDDRAVRRVVVDPQGPVLIEGPVEITLPDGTTARSDRFTVAVCTCRRSRRYPWCDTSHRRRENARPEAGHPAGSGERTADSASETGGTMTTARQIMSKDVECVDERETLADAARTMARLGVGALPVRGTDEKLKGMLTDRDIVVRALGAGKDPGTTKASELARGEVVFVRADDGVDQVLRTMARHKVRRLPVMEDHRLVGVIARADAARALPGPQVGDLLEALSAE